MSRTKITILATAAFYAVLIAYSDASDFSDRLAGFDIRYLPPALALGTAALLVRAARQKVLLDAAGVRLGAKRNISLYLAGAALTATPGGLGQAVRSYDLKKRGVDVKTTLPLTPVEKLHDVAALVMLLWAALIFHWDADVAAAALAASAAVAAALLAVRSERAGLAVSRAASKIPVLRRYKEFLSESAKSASAMAGSRASACCSSLSVASWGLDAAAIYLVFAGFGLDFGIAYTTLVAYAGVLLGALSLLPGGVGVADATTAGLLVRGGTDIATAAAAAFMIRLVGTWYVTGIGLAARLRPSR